MIHRRREFKCVGYRNDENHLGVSPENTGNSAFTSKGKSWPLSVSDISKPTAVTKVVRSYNVYVYGTRSICPQLSDSSASLLQF